MDARGSTSGASFGWREAEARTSDQGDDRRAAGRGILKPDQEAGRRSHWGRRRQAVDPNLGVFKPEEFIGLRVPTARERATLERLEPIRKEVRKAPATHAQATYLAREFLQATLPHQDPKSATWRRVNGSSVLGIQAGVDHITGFTYGIPYGSIPRLLLFWITSEAVRTKNPVIEMGPSLTAFMAAVGLSPRSGGGPDGVAARLDEQWRRLTTARISFVESSTDASRQAEGQCETELRVTRSRESWWKRNASGEVSNWSSRVELDADFYRQIIAHPVPVDVRVLRGLRRSPMALDLYALLCYESSRAQERKKGRLIKYQWLAEQLGANYTGDKRMKEFARNLRGALDKILLLSPTIKVEVAKSRPGFAGGIFVLSNSAPPIPRIKPWEHDAVV